MPKALKDAISPVSPEVARSAREVARAVMSEGEVLMVLVMWMARVGLVRRWFGWSECGGGRGDGSEKLAGDGSCAGCTFDEE